jgi:hypothetical protein
MLRAWQLLLAGLVSLLAIFVVLRHTPEPAPPRAGDVAADSQGDVPSFPRTRRGSSRGTSILRVPLQPRPGRLRELRHPLHRPGVGERHIPLKARFVLALEAGEIAGDVVEPAPRDGANRKK